MICENLPRYSCITAELSFRKNLWRYFGIKADRHANARAGMIDRIAGVTNHGTQLCALSTVTLPSLLKFRYRKGAISESRPCQ